jgi:hypothetical protein
LEEPSKRLIWIDKGCRLKLPPWKADHDSIVVVSPISLYTMRIFHKLPRFNLGTIDIVYSAASKRYSVKYSAPHS